MRTYGRSLLLFLFCVLVSACSGQEMEQDGGDLTRSEVEYLSTRLQEAVEKEFPVLRHKLVNRYVNNLGQSIISRNPDLPPLPYEFRLLRANEALVFSLPGGLVYLTLGTLRELEFEGQLAAAIAHELAHQQLNHQLVVWRRKVNANRGQHYLLDFSGPWHSTFLGSHGLLRFGKEMEKEADALAPVLLYRAKFDPRLYVAYLEALQKLGKVNGEKVAALNSLHPPTPERIAWAKETILKLPPLRDASVSSPTFQQIKSILQQAAKKGAERQELQ